MTDATPAPGPTPPEPAPAARPRVVALGGGHGTAATLSAVRRYASDITAIVSVADDGGSSGRLRQAFGMPAPGDLRRCLVALSDAQDSPLARAFEHRFDDVSGAGLHGHALGNLVIAGLTAATGSFTTALEEAGRLLGVKGRVLPATCTPVVLKALGAHGEIEGQVNVALARGRISHVSIVPPYARPPQAAIHAIHQADQLVLGPGSLFTSVLAVVAVPALREALQQAGAPIVYVANLRTSEETAGFDLAAHLDALRAHGVEPDVVLYDPSQGLRQGDTDGIRVERRDLAGTDGHDPAKLARALADLVG